MQEPRKIKDSSYLHNNESKYKYCFDRFDGPIGGNERFSFLVKKFFENISGKNILEIACAEGSFLKLLEGLGNKAFGVDISESGIRKTREKGISSEKIDIAQQAIPRPDDSFDIVVMLEAIEHIENPIHCIKEIKRVLKDNGILLISIPNPVLGHDYYYPGLFEVSSFKKFLLQNDFKIQKIIPWGQGLKTNFLMHRLHNVKRNIIEEAFYKVLYYLIRKRNMLFKKIGTPLRYSHCINFYCVSYK